ncbi:MAG TPA: M15 family metallopeptidase [Gemmatimonadaceae bacterium]|nr:M15 family metallopeptidase [Gemmatimonadaceae bacterium]
MSLAAVLDHTNARDTRNTDERGRDPFAAVMAGALHTHAPKPMHAKPKEGTSELDAPDESSEAEDAKRTSGTSGTKAAKDAKDARAAKAAADRADRFDAASTSNEVDRSLAALDPALQAKLARVMARMREETGQDVKVTETYRNQSRQDALFAQGRQTGGPVVTWTQNSKHTQGRAVDVMLDGASATPDAYAILQRIAKEEGLRTLGARDPGHLELPSTTGNGGSSAANDTTPKIPAAPADATGPGLVSIARLAQLAEVSQVSTAKVARPAQVARVASVGQPGVAGALPKGAPNAQGAHSQFGGADTGSQRFGADSGKRGSDSSAGDKGAGGYGALDAALAMRDQSGAAPFSLHGVTAATGSTAAERAARMIAAMEDAPARPLSQITMSVEAGNGATDRIQVGLRGSTLNATIDAGDTRGAHAMSARTDELVRALTRDGVEVESLRVRATANVAAPLATPASRGSADSQSHPQNGSRFERGNPWQQQDKQRSQDDRRQQQRDQRGGKSE